MIYEQWIIKDLERIGRGPSEVLSPNFPEGLKIAKNVRLDSRCPGRNSNPHLPNTSIERCHWISPVPIQCRTSLVMIVDLVKMTEKPVVSYFKYCTGIFVWREMSRIRKTEVKPFSGQGSEVRNLEFHSCIEHTSSMEQNPCWEANSRTVDQEIPCRVLCIYKSPLKTEVLCYIFHNIRFFLRGIPPA
jgi:hypothetical protein